MFQKGNQLAKLVVHKEECKCFKKSCNGSWIKSLPRNHEYFKILSERMKKNTYGKANKGNHNIGGRNKGILFSMKHKRKLSEIRRKMIKEGKISRINNGNFKRGQFLGDKHWNWQGGKSKNKRNLTLSEYVNWRKSVFKRDDYTCQFCNQRGGWIEADHVKCWSKYPELRFDINNGRTLCRPCHETTFKGNHL